jgi:hypothetical protein
MSFKKWLENMEHERQLSQSAVVSIKSNPKESQPSRYGYMKKLKADNKKYKPQ